MMLPLPGVTVNPPMLENDNKDNEILSLLASERALLPSDGALLYDCQELGSYVFTESNGATGFVSAADHTLPFGKKFTMDIRSAASDPWEPQLQTPVNRVPVSSGDWILYVFHIRTTDTEMPNDFGQAAFYSQQVSSPWTTIGSLNLSLNTSWQKFYLVTQSANDYAPGEMIGTFHLGFMQQEVEIGGMFGLNLGPDVDPGVLPSNAITYGGMEADASWRDAAAQRIENHRKSDIRITVTDATNVLIPGAEVTLRMKAHAYGFGTFISDFVLEDSQAADLYSEHVLDMFNCATTPFYMGGNSDNWGWYGSATAQQDYPGLARWLEVEGIPAKGHVLIWPGWKWMPSAFEALRASPADLDAAIDRHLETIVPIGKANGISEWDVVNEPYINHDVMDILGEEVLVEWYNKVHELDPDSRLILNEYNIIMGGGRPDYQANFERLIRFLQDNDAPLGGIGMQCHFDELLTGIPEVLDILDRFAVFGLPIQITEYDVAVRDEAIKAGYLRDFYTAVFSHQATDKIVMWGFFEQVMWKPLAALVNSDWTYNPAYHTYMDLVYDEWWTPDTTGTTGEDGSFELRGFNGTYELSVSVGDSVYTVADTLITSDAAIRIEHDIPAEPSL